MLDPGTSFARLDADDAQKNPEQLEREFLADLAQSDLHVIANVDGYIGQSALIEMGFSVGQGRPIFTLTPVTEEPWCHFVKPLSDLDEYLSTCAKDADEESRVAA